jgi:hypothetical protein
LELGIERCGREERAIEKNEWKADCSLWELADEKLQGIKMDVTVNQQSSRANT